MDRLITLSWLVLAAIHVSPAAVLVRPELASSLYGVSPSGSTGVLIVHRRALFLAVVVVAAYAAFISEARKAASLLVAISVLSFLAIYLLAGAPAGALRRIAVADSLALAPLALVAWDAWRRS